jgi:hypothetical protein
MNSPQKKDIEELVDDLKDLSDVYIAAPIQDEKYSEILANLREHYKQSKEKFSPKTIATINYLKEKFEKRPFSGQGIGVIDFLDSDNYIEAYLHARANRGLPKNTVVFHQNKYFLGVNLEKNVVNQKYKFLLSSGEYQWMDLRNLLVVGTCKVVWLRPEGREAHCWQCKRELGMGDKKCTACGWYGCHECGACKCNFNGYW